MDGAEVVCAGNDVPSAPQAQMVSTRSAWSFILDL
jgi:hypothetical protein